KRGPRFLHCVLQVVRLSRVLLLVRRSQVVKGAVRPIVDAEPNLFDLVLEKPDSLAASPPPTLRLANAIRVVPSRRPGIAIRTLEALSVLHGERLPESLA